jgi:hypothetical protein
MYTHTRPLCTLQFRSMNAPFNENGFHERVVSLIRPNRQLSYPLPFLLNSEDETRQFLKDHCNIQDVVGPVTYNLSCFAGGSWRKLDKGKGLSRL